MNTFFSEYLFSVFHQRECFGLCFRVILAPQNNFQGYFPYTATHPTSLKSLGMGSSDLAFKISLKKLNPISTTPIGMAVGSHPSTGALVTYQWPLSKEKSASLCQQLPTAIAPQRSVWPHHPLPPRFQFLTGLM